jgi:hypothetical protein
MRVAVLGAGLAGCCVALELADAGFEVTLFDRAVQPLSRASLGNEGKIHLGLVYANDASGRTAQTMAMGAACFEPLLGRWLASDSLGAATSDPFIYAVPTDSLLPADAIRQYFNEVRRLWEAATPAGSGSYLRSIERPFWSELKVGSDSDLFDPRMISHAFATQERAVDPTRICAELRTRVAAEPRLDVRCLTEITTVGREPRGGFRVEFRDANADAETVAVATERFDTVVNALWEQRLAIDHTLDPGVVARPVVHRYKVGIRCDDPAVARGMPTVTFMLGSYGDTVAYPESAYASWYPTGLRCQEFTLKPSRAEIHLSADDQQQLVVDTLGNLRRFMPGAADVLQPAVGHWRAVGGYITAWGRSGIEEASSELHQRHAVGVYSTGDYHSIDTGKFTTAPMFAAEACARIRACRAKIA